MCVAKVFLHGLLMISFAVILTSLECDVCLFVCVCVSVCQTAQTDTHTATSTLCCEWVILSWSQFYSLLRLTPKLINVLHSSSVLHSSGNSTCFDSALPFILLRAPPPIYPLLLQEWTNEQPEVPSPTPQIRQVIWLKLKPLIEVFLGLWWNQTDPCLSTCLIV